MGVEEAWSAIMRLYEGAQTKLKVGSVMSDGFSVGVRSIQPGFVLLFAIVMDAISEDARKGLLFEILYADDLVLMVDSMEELRTKFDR